MALVWVLLAIVVLGGVAVVAAGRGQGLTVAEPDRPDLTVPPDRPLMRTDVDMLRFSVGLRGYRMDEVDDVLDRLAYDLEARDARISVLEQEVAARWTAATAPAAGTAAGDEPATFHEAEPEQTEPEQTEPEPTVPEQTVPEPTEPEQTQAEAHEAEPAAEEADEVSEVDEGELLVGRTLIVPFQQTDSRFATGGGADGEPAAGPGAGPTDPARDPASDQGPERGA